MRGSAPIITCDADDGLCGNWDVDHYETGASKVGGTRLTDKARIPGWTTTDEGDFCVEHTRERA